MNFRGSLRDSMRGFTMVELLVTIAVFAVIASIAAPSIAQNLANRRIRNAAAELQSSILQARSLAVIASRPVEMWPTYTSSWNVPNSSRGDSVTGQPVSIPNTSDEQMATIAKAKLSWVVVTAGAAAGTSVTATLANSADNYPIQVSLPDQTLITVTTSPATATPDATKGIRFFQTGGIGNITASGTISTPFTQLTFLICDSAAPTMKGYTVIVNQFGSVRTAGGATCT